MQQSFQVALTELEPPDGRDFWFGNLEDDRGPTFTVRETSVVFFGRTRYWLKSHLAEATQIDGEPFVIQRQGEYKMGRYEFTLAKIERMAHSLFSSGIIDLNRFENAITIIKAIGKNYRLI